MARSRGTGRSASSSSVNKAARRTKVTLNRVAFFSSIFCSTPFTMSQVNFRFAQGARLHAHTGIKVYHAHRTMVGKRNA